MTTTLKIKNTTEESQLFYVTLGSYPEGYIQSVKGIFGIETDGLQGSFELKPGETRSYTSPEGLALSGNITAGSPPLNGPTKQFAHGICLAEFTLNNKLIQPPGQQETVDISCVPGCNAKWKFILSGKPWNASPKYPDVPSFENDERYKNTGNVGVYPFLCDVCIGSENPPPDWGDTKPATPQSAKICNVQRPAEDAGESVEIHFLGYC